MTALTHPGGNLTGFINLEAFPGRDEHQPLTTRQFSRLFKEASKAAGLRKTLSLHSLLGDYSGRHAGVASRRLELVVTKQRLSGRFEILVWNNNYEIREEIERLYDKYRAQFDLKVIHSTENFYCVIRLAVASLIRSDFILVCDDDVKPLPDYISLFMEKAKEYPDCVLCCRGHLFKPHVLNEEEPQRFWTDYEHLEFFDESKSDRRKRRSFSCEVFASCASP